jgi:DNA polymerase-4
MERKIIHVDMDYFFAQVEIKDKPELANLPVAIGSQSSRRGVLSTCNYIARSFGVRSAMPTYKALELCPDLVLLGSNFSKYKEASEKVFSIFYEYTDKVECISIDEAYLDVTECQEFSNSATLIAKDILERIYLLTGLTASAGVSYNKLLSKIASEKLKPNGLYIIPPNTKKCFYESLSVMKINGVGKVLNEKLLKKNILTFGDLQKYSKLDLINNFGSFGNSLYYYSRGEDFRDVTISRERKSLSVERTFEFNIDNISQLALKLTDCYEEMINRLKKFEDRDVKTICLKIKFSSFIQITIEKPAIDLSYDSFHDLLVSNGYKITEPVRLIGLGVKFFGSEKGNQLALPFA